MSTRKRRPNANASRSSAGRYTRLATSPSPRMYAPMTAPGRLPIPPTTITVKARSSSGRPILESSELYAKARSTPARPPRPEEMKKVAAIARSTSIPRMRAARGFSASARISRPRAVPSFLIHVGDATLEGIRLAIIGLSIALMLVLTYLVRGTALGREIRALAENPRAARILGIDVERAIAATFFISSGLGGLAGVLLAFAYNSLDSRMGLPLELRAFTVMVVGGMGSLPGAVIGAYILGLGEVASLVYLP